jgi:hypothetical protein
MAPRRQPRVSPSVGAAAVAGPSRVAAARSRAETAKVALAGGGAVIFALAMVLARVSVSGHAKPTIQSLSAPQRFTAVVHSDQLRAGILGPTQAPPGAATSVS